jgi:Arc/MetJ-type ribon-helix-helix transcriptional regulator
MNLEIRNPELVERVNAHIQTGEFHDADELLEKALDALDERTAAAPVTTPARKTGAAILAALQACPYPEIDLTPPRVPIFVRDVEL